MLSRGVNEERRLLKRYWSAIFIANKLRLIQLTDKNRDERLKTETYSTREYNNIVVIELNLLENTLSSLDFYQIET